MFVVMRMLVSQYAHAYADQLMIMRLAIAVVAVGKFQKVY